MFYANLTMSDYLWLSDNPETPNLIPIIHHIKTLKITDFGGGPGDLNPYSFIKFNVSEADQV